MNTPDRRAEIHDRLVDAVEAMVSGADWQRLLDLGRRFHAYWTGVSGISELCECSRRHQAEGWEALVR